MPIYKIPVKLSTIWYQDVCIAACNADEAFTKISELDGIKDKDKFEEWEAKISSINGFIDMVDGPEDGEILIETTNAIEEEWLDDDETIEGSD